ncbi:MauE/DoxX family redox-associated membrane protein [Paraconexibacter sp.]|uniref:MauE/DoxX family redox-associated membrane protein n=1 Tax=Paraconexibacter sp. TaxID=2949640 RepID=UPI00356399F7
MTDAALLVARHGLALVFLTAGIAKARNLPRTRASLREFGLPAGAAAPVLIVAEAACGVLLLLPGTSRVGAGLATGLLAVFTVAVLRVLADGRSPSCACFGELTQAAVGRRTVARNVGLAALAAVLAFAGPGTSGSAGMVEALAAGTIGAAVLLERCVLARAAGPRRGVAAPDFSLPRADGSGHVSLTDLLARGKPVALVFLSPTCGPCEDLAPRLAVLREQLAPTVTLQEISCGTADESHPGGAVLVGDPELADRYGASAKPAAVGIGADGRVLEAPALGALAIEELLKRVTGRPGAPHTFVAVSHDVTFSITVDDAAAAARAQAMLPHGSLLTGAGSEPTRFTIFTPGAADGALYVDHGFSGRHADVDVLLETLAARVRVHVAEHAPRHAFVHAGVVAWQERAIVIPGRSFSGKSTLVTALLRQGARYLSDEYAVIDSDGLVHPFDKPIALRAPGTRTSVEHPVSQFTSLPVQAEPLPIGAVVRAPYEPAARWEPVPGTTGAGVLALIDNCVGIRRDPSRVMATLRRAMAGAVFVDGPRGDADETARALLTHLSAHVEPPAAA